MKFFPRFMLLLVLAIALLRFPGFTGCANIVPPTGGPRDTLPPVLVKAQPGENATKFSGKTDPAYIRRIPGSERYPQKPDRLAPSPVQPTVSFKLRNILIELKDTLKPNTTYYFDFGNAVTDNTREISSGITVILSAQATISIRLPFRATSSWPIPASRTAR